MSFENSSGAVDARSRFGAELAERHGALLVAIFFVLTRIPLRILRPFRFDHLGGLMQALDPALLRNDLGVSLLTLHSQPPLYNLFLGIFLKAVPDAMEATAMALLYGALTLFIVLGVHRLARARGVSARAAVVTASLFSLWPTIIWGEGGPGYHIPVIALLVGMALLLDRFVATSRLRHALLFLLLAAALPLTRSFFHLLVWMIPVIALLLRIAAVTTLARWKRLILPAFLCIVPVYAVYHHNLVNHGMFTASTWQGMNIAGIVTHVPKEGIENLIEANEVTPLARIKRFSAPGEYHRYYFAQNPPPQKLRITPALNDTVKSTGSINWNHKIYAKASREYQRNTFAIARAYPLQSALGIVNQAYIFCSLQTYTIFGSPDRWWVPGPSPLGVAKVVALVYIVPVVMLILLLMAVRYYLRGVTRGTRTFFGGEPTRPADLFIGFTILYTIVVACMAELGEGSIMRAQFDPFLAVAVAVLLGKRFRTRKLNDIMLKRKH